MAHRLVFLALIGASVIAFASPGASAPRRDEAKCLKVSSGLLSNLRDGLRDGARGKLGTPKAVKSRGSFGGLRDIREGPVYFVSAKVRGYGIATWAVGGQAFKTGGGAIIAVGPVARRVSIHGVDIPPSTLEAWGLAPYADGYDESRACVN